MLFSLCPWEAQITTCAYQEITTCAFASLLMLCLQGEKGKSLGAVPVTLPQVYPLFGHTIFILFLLCFQNNSHEEHLGCDYYVLCWGIWHLRLHFLKYAVAFKVGLQNNASVRCIHTAAVFFLDGSGTALSHLIWILLVSQFLQQETCVVQESKWKGEWGGTMKPTWLFLSPCLGRCVRAWRSYWIRLFIWVIWTYFM